MPARSRLFRLAQAHGLAGWVRNLAGEVEIHAQGESLALTRFAAALISNAPPLAQPVLARHGPAALQALAGFAILASEASVCSTRAAGPAVMRTSRRRTVQARSSPWT